MKIAKKLFALAVVVAMIAGLSTMAFAADTYKFALKAEKEDKDYVKVTLTAVDAVGFKTGTANIKYDDSVLEFESVELGKDAAEVNDKVKADKNKFVDQPNSTTVPGTVVYGFYFLENLWTAKDFAAASKRGVTAEVNSDNFEVAVFYFKITDAKAENTKITMIGSGDMDVTPIEVTVAIADGKGSDEETTAAEAETEATTAAADTETTTAAATTVAAETTTAAGTKPANAGPATGDNSALAVTAGICALAAIAFVATRKKD